MKVRLTDICTPKQWKTIPTSELLNEGYPVYGANGIIGYYNGYNHESPVVTITCRGATCGTINITAPKSYVTGNAMCLDDLRPDVLLEYLYYSLLHYNFRNVISGSAQPQITRQGLEKVNIELHSLDEQRKIVNVLSMLETAILARKSELQKLDELIKARFVEMFGNCEKVSLNEIADIIMGQSPNSKYYNDNGDGIPFFQGKADYGVKYTHVAHWTTEPNKIVEKNTVLMSVRAPVGPVNLASVKCCLGRGLCGINAKPGLTNNEFLYNALKVSESEISKMGTGSTFKAITKKDVFEIKVPNAPLELQDEFSCFSQQVDKSKVAIQKSLDLYQELFDKLMNDYFGD